MPFLVPLHPYASLCSHRIFLAAKESEKLSRLTISENIIQVFTGEDP